MPGPARRRGGDNAGGGGRRWGQSGSGALGPAKAGPAVAEIGRVPCRDRFSSASRSVRRRRARGPGPRGGLFGARWAFRRESDGGVVGLAPKCRPRRERGRAPAGVVPHERRTARPARARPAPRGRTRARTVVPRSTESYPTPRGRTLKPPYSTTRRRSVRPRAFMYDRANPGRTVRVMTTRAVRSLRPREPGYDRPEVTAAGPVGRTTTRATAPPHDPPTAPDPTRPITPTPRPRPPTPTASRTARPSDNHHPPPAPSRTTPPHNHDKRTDLEPELNRSRRRRAGSGEPRCQASLTRLSMSSTLFMSRKRDTC